MEARRQGVAQNVSRIAGRRGREVEEDIGGCATLDLRWCFEFAITVAVGAASPMSARSKWRSARWP